MVEISKKFEIKFNITDENEDITHQVEGADNWSEAYNKIRSELCQDRGISIGDFESAYNTSQRIKHVSFKDKPWDDEDELENDLRKIDGIKSIRYISPYQGAYTPPKYHISTELDAYELEQNIKDYYDGLVVNKKNGSLYVVVSSAFHA